jgi:acyl-CoA thioester hydrolase
MTSPRLLVHTSVQPMRWADMDALGHVNNTVYFRYMEQARIEWLFGLPEAVGAYQGTHGAVVVNASCNFLVPLVYPADVEVRMYIGHPGRSSIMSYYDLLVQSRKYADGAAKIVWVDFATGRSTPLPEAVAAPLRTVAG